MGERYWQQVEWSDGSPPVVTPVGPSLTDAEVLAEMPTVALVEELMRRGVSVVNQVWWKEAVDDVDVPSVVVRPEPLEGGD